MRWTSRKGGTLRVLQGDPKGLKPLHLGIVRGFRAAASGEVLAKLPMAPMGPQFRIDIRRPYSNTVPIHRSWSLSSDPPGLCDPYTRIRERSRSEGYSQQLCHTFVLTETMEHARGGLGPPGSPSTLIDGHTSGLLKCVVDIADRCLHDRCRGPHAPRVDFKPPRGRSSCASPSGS